MSQKSIRLVVLLYPQYIDLLPKRDDVEVDRDVENLHVRRSKSSSPVSSVSSVTIPVVDGPYIGKDPSHKARVIHGTRAVEHVDSNNS